LPSFWADIHEKCKSIANTSKPKCKPLQNKESWHKGGGKKSENPKQRLIWKINTDRKRKTRFATMGASISVPKESRDQKRRVSEDI
jgi:hypothetical protein